MTAQPYPYAKHVLWAAVFSLTGQASAILFMIRPNPYTTLVFMTVGVALIGAGIALFGYSLVRDIRGRMQSVSERAFEKGEFVFRQGEIGDRIYIVKTGEVEVIREQPPRGEVVLARLGRGEYFGEMALLTDAPRNASVRAATELITLAIDRADFHRLFASIPAFQDSIDAVIEQREVHHVHSGHTEYWEKRPGKDGGS
ncbi:MAG: cyclic nucleotide-binding domain-containing protein [bacterium]|nr:cyclic nucleotide-binding domain-containing protein [bacterium]